MTAIPSYYYPSEIMTSHPLLMRMQFEPYITRQGANLDFRASHVRRTPNPYTTGKIEIYKNWGLDPLELHTPQPVSVQDIQQNSNQIPVLAISIDTNLLDATDF